MMPLRFLPGKLHRLTDGFAETAERGVAAAASKSARAARRYGWREDDSIKTERGFAPSQRPLVT